MDKQQKWIRKQCLTYALTCSMANNRTHMIRRKEYDNMKMGKVSLYSNASKTKLVDVLKLANNYVYFSFNHISSRLMHILWNFVPSYTMSF